MPNYLNSYSFTVRGDSSLYDSSYRDPSSLPFKSLLRPTQSASPEIAAAMARFPQASFHSCRYPTEAKDQRRPYENFWHGHGIGVDSPVDKHFLTSKLFKAPLPYNPDGNKPVPKPVLDLSKQSLNESGIKGKHSLVYRPNERSESWSQSNYLYSDVKMKEKNNQQNPPNSSPSHPWQIRPSTASSSPPVIVKGVLLSPPLIPPQQRKAYTKYNLPERNTNNSSSIAPTLHASRSEPVLKTQRQIYRPSASLQL
jgi:hypothetical protein